jgi:hypothetical protein
MEICPAYAGLYGYDGIGEFHQHRKKADLKETGWFLKTTS